MSVSDPIVKVQCDKCGVEDMFEMCALAQNSWDLRYLNADLKRARWKGTADDNEHICESCQEEDEEK